MAHIEKNIILSHVLTILLFSNLIMVVIFIAFQPVLLASLYSP
jgi:hypothetical protein